MAENPRLTSIIEEVVTPMEVVALPLPPLWNHLAPHEQRQLAQLVGELIRRIRNQTLQLEGRHHDL